MDFYKLTWKLQDWIQKPRPKLTKWLDDNEHWLIPAIVAFGITVVAIFFILETYVWTDPYE